MIPNRTMLLGALTLLAGAPANAAPVLDGRWWIVIGSSPDPEYLALPHPAADRAAADAKRCDVEVLGDYSGKWQSFAPGFYVVAAGGYRSRAEATRILARVRRCVPDAYLRSARYAGE